MEEGKIGEVDVKQSLRKNILRDLNYLLSKGLISEREVYYLIKNFLKNYLKLDYEFTKEELIGELKNIYLPYKIRSDFLNFIDRVFVFEYAHAGYNDEELRSFLLEFKSYIDYLLVPSKTVASGQRLLQKIRSKIVTYLSSEKKDANVIEKEILQENIFKKEEREATSLMVQNNVLSQHIDINSIIEKIYNSIDHGDQNSALLLYNELMIKYESLTSNEKASYYELLEELYLKLEKL
jgi:hypothetical protein